MAAHYRPPEKEGPLDFKITGSSQEQEEHMPTRTSAIYSENKDAVHQANWQAVKVLNTDKYNYEGKMSMCAHECCNCVAGTGEKICYVKVGNAVKFTPTAFLAGKVFWLKGDNYGAKWESDSTCTLQPMKLSETGASVINMPSLLQGQAFSEPIPPLHGTHRLHHRSNSQPAASRGFSYPAPLPSDCSCCLRGQVGMGTTTTGWKRHAHSATMYTRYRSPEYALMYSDLEYSSTSAASCVWSSNDLGYRKLRYSFNSIFAFRSF